MVGMYCYPIRRKRRTRNHPASREADLISREVVVALGTRPEAIKLFGVIRELGDRATVIHTGQHYDEKMWNDVLRSLPGLKINHSIAVGGRSRGEQIGAGTELITRYLVRNPPHAMVVQGDTNSTLAGALAATSLNVPVIHVEAGLRSFDRAMPEEINRVLVDAVSELCCSPVEANAENLIAEGVSDRRIVVTGNTLADSFDAIVPPVPARAEILKGFGIGVADPFTLSTIHRASLIEDAHSLQATLEALDALARRTRVILPLHPHTERQINEYGFNYLLCNVSVLPPLSPPEFLTLEMSASLIVSDSGGVQEEACLLRRPLLVMRDSTERPELLDGWCRLLGDEEPQVAVERAWVDAHEWAHSLSDRPLPYPSHGASKRIVEELSARWLR